MKGLEHLRLHEGSVHRKLQKSEKKIEKIFGAPTHPTAAQKPQDGRREHFSRRRRPSSKQGNTESLRKIGELRRIAEASLYGVLEFKPRLKGSLGNGPSQQRRAVP